MAIKNVVLVGASGLVGGFILASLQSSPADFNITLLTRPSSTSSLPPGYPVLRFDFSDPALVSALRDQKIDAIVCAVSSAATLSQLPLIEAAVKGRVRHFIPTEYASDTLNPVLPTLISWYRDKRSVHDRLVQLGTDHSWFGYTGIISGPFFSWGIASGFLGYDVEEKTAWIYDDGALPVSYSEISQVGLAVARALERGVTGYLRISSVTATQNDIMAALERLSGTTWRKGPRSTNFAHTLSAEMMKSDSEEESSKGSMLRAMRWVYGADCGGNWGEGDNAKLGLETKEIMDGMVELALQGQFE